jgi:polar amino acid transport system substrate-binding protein
MMMNQGTRSWNRAVRTGWESAARTLLRVGRSARGLSVLGLLLLGGTACGPKTPGAKPVERTVRVGYAIEAPFSYLDANGRVTGESPEVARVVAARLGLKIEWVQRDFGALIAGLEAEQFDVIAAGMFVTAERAERVLFSRPTCRVEQGLLVRKDNPLKLHSYQQLVGLPGVKIAVLDASVEESLLRRMGLGESNLLVVPDALSGRIAVETGVADGIALSAPAISWMSFQGQLNRTEPAEPFLPPPRELTGELGYCAFAFRKTDTELASAWDAELGHYLGTSEHRELLIRLGLAPLTNLYSATSLQPGSPNP